MRTLDINEHKLCQMVGDLFVLSLDKSNFSSSMFIRRFLNSDYSSLFFNKNYLILSLSKEEIIEEINSSYLSFKKGTMYNEEEMYWIGYIYTCLSFLYNLNGKTLYKLFKGDEIKKYYLIYHTFGIEQAAERMMENINYKETDYLKEGVAILKRLLKEETYETKIIK